MCCELTMGIPAPNRAWRLVGSQYCLGMVVVTKPSYFRKNDLEIISGYSPSSNPMVCLLKNSHCIRFQLLL